MEKRFSGRIWKFGDDIDTDTIIPGKRGTIPDRNEMKKYAFELLKPEFGSTVQAGDILVAGSNFGCGSSREHAAWAIADYGFRVVISSFFADIHKNNELNNFVLPVVVSEGFLSHLFQSISADAATVVEVNLPEQTVTNKATGETEHFDINGYKKYCLMNGLDDIDFLVQNRDKVAAFERARA